MQKGILPTSAKRSPKKLLHLGPDSPNSRTPKSKRVSWTKGFSNDFCWRCGTCQSVERSPKFCRNHFTRTIRGCCEWTYAWDASILGGSPGLCARVPWSLTGLFLLCWQKRNKRRPCSRKAMSPSVRSGVRGVAPDPLSGHGRRAAQRWSSYGVWDRLMPPSHSGGVWTLSY